MRTVYFILYIVSFAHCSLQSQHLEAAWAQSIGGYAQEYATDLTIDHEGNLWGIGYINGPKDSLPNAGQEDVYLFKMDQDGSLM